METRTVKWPFATRRIWVCLLVALLALVGMGFSPTVAHASSTTTLVVQVRQDNAAATSMLKQINAQRKKSGLVKLKLDKELTAAAITRAAEVAVYMPLESPHRRPDGRLARTVNGRTSYECCAESTNCYVSMIMDSWMDSPSHRAGILLQSARSVGIACVSVGKSYQMYENQQVWILEFSGSAAKASIPTTGNKTYTKKVRMTNANAKAGKFSVTDRYTGLKKTVPLELGSTCEMNTTFKSKRTTWATEISPKSFTWKSSNPTVARVNKNGVVKAKKRGSAVITGRLKNGLGRQVKIRVKVTE